MEAPDEQKIQGRMKRVAVTGPESTGKSWLSENLARHFDTFWVPEYARQYLKEINRAYDYEDILAIARGQAEREDDLMKKATAVGKQLIFCDTESIVTHIWCKVKYGRSHRWILKNIEKQPYDLYLLCDIDLPWEYDPLREHPEMRKELFTMYESQLQSRQFNYSVIRGSGSQRLDNAVREVERLLLL